MANFDWNSFMGDRRVQSGAVGLGALALSRALGLGWLPSAAIGTAAGGMYYGGSKLLENPNAGEEKNKRKPQTQTNPSKSPDGKDLSAFKKQYIDPLNPNSANNPIYSGSRYGVQSLYSSNPEIANAAWKDYDGKLAKDREEAAAQERAYIRKVQESDALYDAQDAENQSRLSDEIARQEAAYKAAQEARKRRAAEVAFGKREQAIEDEVMNTDRRLQEEYDERVAARDAFIKQRKAKNQTMLALLMVQDMLSKKKNQYEGIYGLDPHIQSNEDAFNAVYTEPIKKHIVQPAKDMSARIKNRFIDLIRPKTAAPTNAKDNELLSAIAAVKALLKTDPNKAARILKQIILPQLDKASPKVKNKLLELELR